MGFRGGGGFGVSFSPSSTALIKSIPNSKAAVSQLTEGTKNLYDPKQSAFQNVKDDVTSTKKMLDTQFKKVGGFFNGIGNSISSGKVIKSLINVQAESLKNFDAGNISGLIVNTEFINAIANYFNIDFNIEGSGNILVGQATQELKSSALENMYTSLTEKLNVPEINVELPKADFTSSKGSSVSGKF